MPGMCRIEADMEVQGKQQTALSNAAPDAAESDTLRRGIDLQALFAVGPDSLCAFQLNLTDNLCMGEHGTSKYIISSLKTDTADGVFRNIEKIIPDPGERSAFESVFSCARIREEYSHGKSDFSLDYHRRGEKGNIIFVRTSLKTLKYPGSDTLIGIVYSRDITSQKLQEKALQILTGQEYQLIAVMDPQTKEMEAVYIGENLPPEYAEFFKKEGDVYPIAEVRREIADKWISPEDVKTFMDGTDSQILAERLKTSVSDDFIVRVIAPDNGQGTGYRRSQHYWLDEGHTKMLVLIADVTRSVSRQREELEKEKALREKADAANKAKSDFLSRMSHDIRTPLNAILGITHLSLERQHSEKTTGELQKIELVSRFLLGMMNDILDVSAGRDDQIELNLQPCLFEDFAACAETLARQMCAGKALNLIADTHPAIQYAPVMDVFHINQVLFQLLSNAVKFTPEGGTITLGLYQQLTAEGRLCMRLAVSDTGSGISEEFQKVMFDLFTQEHRDDNSFERGTGLGLSVVKKIVDAMGGKIEVSSKPGKGTVITVINEFDCVPAEKVRADKAYRSLIDEDILSGKHILLCEDQPLNQEIASALLKEKGMIVETADNGEAGVRKYEQSAPGYYAAILMDIRMPLMDGYEATRQIRAMNRDDAKTIPILAMTAEVNMNDRQKCLDLGMDGHVPKPINPAQMYEMLIDSLTRQTFKL